MADEWQVSGRYQALVADEWQMGGRPVACATLLVADEWHKNDQVSQCGADVASMWPRGCFGNAVEQARHTICTKWTHSYHQQRSSSRSVAGNNTSPTSATSGSCRSTNEPSECFHVLWRTQLVKDLVSTRESHHGSTACAELCLHTILHWHAACMCMLGRCGSNDNNAVRGNLRGGTMVT